METNIPNNETEPNQHARTNWILIAVIIMLCIVSLVQGIILFRMKTERDGILLGRKWHERLQKVLPGLADKSKQVTFGSPDNQVIFWEPTDDLEQIHDQINRLLRNMTPPLGSSKAGRPFPGVAIQRESGNRPPAIQTPSRDLNQLQREIEQIFEDAYNESQQSTLLSRVNRGWDMVPSAAAMNIEEQGSNYVVSIALPGYEKNDISISLEGRLLIVEAAQTTRAPITTAHHTAFRSQGQFHTQIMMPDNIEGGRAQAVYDHDVLRVHIPKTAETNSLVRAIVIR